MGLSFIALIIIGIVAVVLYFIPSDQEPSPELETKKEVIVDSTYAEAEAEAVRLALVYYTSAKETFQIFYDHCSNVSNYEEYYAFILFVNDVESETADFLIEDSKLTEKMIQLGLDDNVEIINAAESFYHVLGLGTACMNDVLDKYG